MRMCTMARSASGPIADMFAGVKAGTILENIKAGRARFIVIKEALFAASGGNMSFRAKMYPKRIVRYLRVTRVSFSKKTTRG